MRFSPKTRGCLSLFLFLLLLAAFNGICLWFYRTQVVPLLVTRIGLTPSTATIVLSWLETPFFVIVVMGVGWLWLKLSGSQKRLEAQGTTEILLFEQAVLPSRALPPFRAQVATVKPTKIWFVVALTIVNIASNFSRPLHGSGPLFGVFEIWALTDLWLSARVSPLQMDADGVRINWHPALSWNQIARAEVWKWPVGTGHRVRLFDAANRKIGQVSRLNSPDEWPLVLDYLRARAGH